MQTKPSTTAYVIKLALGGYQGTVKTSVCLEQAHRFSTRARAEVMQQNLRESYGTKSEVVEDPCQI